AARLRYERNCSLSIGDLVNEAILKLFRLKVMELQSRAHILSLASRLMRQILIDEARKRATAKRNGTVMTLTTNVAQWEMPVDLMMVERALGDLAKIDPERAQIVEMRFFGGMSTGDIAEVLGVSEPTVKRRWASTRAWLRHRLRNLGCRSARPSSSGRRCDCSRKRWSCRAPGRSRLSKSARMFRARSAS